MRLDIGNIDIEAKRRTATVTMLHVQKYDLIANTHDTVGTVALLGHHQ